MPVALPAPVVSIAATAGLALLDVQSALRRLDRDGLVELSGEGWRLTRAATSEMGRPRGRRAGCGCHASAHVDGRMRPWPAGPPA